MQTSARRNIGLHKATTTTSSVDRERDNLLPLQDVQPLQVHFWTPTSKSKRSLSYENTLTYYYYAPRTDHLIHSNTTSGHRHNFSHNCLSDVLAHYILYYLNNHITRSEIINLLEATYILVDYYTRAAGQGSYAIVWVVVLALIWFELYSFGSELSRFVVERDFKWLWTTGTITAPFMEST